MINILRVFSSPDSTLLILANGIIGISLYSLANPLVPALLGHWINQIFLGTFERCIITNDNKYFYCACREEGLVSFSFDGTQINYESILSRTGCEDPVLSSDENTIYLANGF